MGKSPAAGRTTPLDPTEYELNCMKNNSLKTKLLATFYNDYSKAGLFASHMMDYGDDPRQAFFNTYEKRKKK